MKYQLTKKGEKAVFEFISICKIDHNVVVDNELDSILDINFPTRDKILNDISSEKNFHSNVYRRGDKIYSNDWDISERLYKTLILEYGKDFVEEKEDIDSIKRELACQIVEKFEDLLDEKGIKIPCEAVDEEDARDADANDAKIYGIEYWNLVEDIENLL